MIKPPAEDKIVPYILLPEATMLTVLPRVSWSNFKRQMKRKNFCVVAPKGVSPRPS